MPAGTRDSALGACTPAFQPGHDGNNSGPKKRGRTVHRENDISMETIPATLKTLTSHFPENVIN